MPGTNSRAIGADPLFHHGDVPLGGAAHVLVDPVHGRRGDPQAFLRAEAEDVGEPEIAPQCLQPAGLECRHRIAPVVGPPTGANLARQRAVVVEVQAGPEHRRRDQAGAHCCGRLGQAAEQRAHRQEQHEQVIAERGLRDLGTGDQRVDAGRKQADGDEEARQSRGGNAGPGLERPRPATQGQQAGSAASHDEREHPDGQAGIAVAHARTDRDLEHRAGAAAGHQRQVLSDEPSRARGARSTVSGRPARRSRRRPRGSAAPARRALSGPYMSPWGARAATPACAATTSSAAIIQ